MIQDYAGFPPQNFRLSYGRSLGLSEDVRNGAINSLMPLGQLLIGPWLCFADSA